MLEALWAKKEEKDGLMYWLPLTVHLEDTGRIMGLLWEHWLSEGQKRTVADDTDLGKQIAIFIGAIHDIGKASPAFQLKKGFVDCIVPRQMQRQFFARMIDAHVHKEV